MLNKLQNEWRSTAIFTLLLIMLSALFFSRALLSISMLSFIAFSVTFDFRSQVRTFFSTPLLWGMSLLFFLPLISGLWSQDKDQWLDIVRLKLPLLFLPFAFASFFRLTRTSWDLLALAFILLVTGGTIWSLFHYSENMDAINEGYLRAKTIITPLEDDHVRFSLLVTIAIAACGYFLNKNYQRWNFLFWVMLLIVTWQIIYLHILAARTGLLSFYLIALITALWLAVKSIKRSQAFMMIFGLLLIPFIAYNTLPTFRNRVKLFMYELTYFKDIHYMPGANDAIRVISINSGWKVMNANPVIGTGSGDLMHEVNRQYSKDHPEIIDTDRIIPANEWIVYGISCGWPGFIVFTIVMLIPFLMRLKNRLLWLTLNTVMAFSFLFDIGLEVQFGIFIYSFIVCWWWKWLKAEKM